MPLYPQARTAQQDPELMEDFTAQNGIFSFAVAGSGATNSLTSSVATAANPGVTRLRCTANAGSVFGVCALNGVLYGAGIWTFEACVKMSLSDGTDNFTFRIGFGDHLDASDFSDGAYFEYDTASSANWRYATAAGNSRTKTNTSTAVNATNWVRLGVVVNAAGTQAEFFVNGTSVGTETNTIPVAAAQFTGMCVQMVKVLGAGTKDVLIDYMYMRGDLTGTREN